MLPIANRKTLEIPHGLAALAAVICLVLAFATDQASLKESHAESTNPQLPLQQSVEDTRNDDSSQTRSPRDHRERQGNLSLIPWFAVPGGGRG